MALRNDVADLRAEMHAEFSDVKTRLTSLEQMSLSQRRETVNQQDDIYRQQSAIDRLTGRIERIERRLDLTTQ